MIRFGPSAGYHLPAAYAQAHLASILEKRKKSRSHKINIPPGWARGKLEEKVGADLAPIVAMAAKMRRGQPPPLVWVEDGTSWSRGMSEGDRLRSARVMYEHLTGAELPEDVLTAIPAPANHPASEQGHAESGEVSAVSSIPCRRTNATFENPAAAIHMENSPGAMGQAVRPL